MSFALSSSFLNAFSIYVPSACHRFCVLQKKMKICVTVTTDEAYIALNLFFFCLMTDLSSSLFIYSFWTHNASKRLVKNGILVRPTRGLEEKIKMDINPLKPELNSICYLLALLGAHHFLHVSRIRVKLLTFRLLMS